MKRHLLTGALVLGITIWTLSAFAPVSFGAPAPVGSACTSTQIADLKTQVSELQVQILAAHMTPAQRATRTAARKAAINILQRQVRGSTWDPAAAGAARAALQRAKDELSVLTDEGARAALRLQIRTLQDQLAGVRGTALTAEQKATLTAQIDALIAADKADAQAQRLGVIHLRQQLLGVRTQLVACRA
jgi:hypothetical protein